MLCDFVVRKINVDDGEDRGHVVVNIRQSASRHFYSIAANTNSPIGFFS